MLLMVSRTTFQVWFTKVWPDISHVEMGVNPVHYLTIGEQQRKNAKKHVMRQMKRWDILESLR